MTGGQNQSNRYHPTRGALVVGLGTIILILGSIILIPSIVGDDPNLQLNVLEVTSGVVTSIILVIVYTSLALVQGNQAKEMEVQSNMNGKLLNIQKEQQKIQKKQSELMEDQNKISKLNHKAIIAIEDSTIDDRKVNLTLSNRGPGIANNFWLLTKIKFQGSDFVLMNTLFHCLVVVQKDLKIT